MYAGMVFSILSFLVAIPSAIKVFNWTATLYKGSIWLSTPMLYALGFIGLFTVGGLSGLFLAALPVDVSVHDTYFVIAHFHFIMVGGMVTAYLGGLHFWWPKITGKLYPERLGQFSALLIFFGFVLTFLPQFLLGRLGMNRRYYHYAPGIPTAQCDVHGGRFHPCGGVSVSVFVSALVAEIWTVRARKSLGSDRTGVADVFAATHVQF